MNYMKSLQYILKHRKGVKPGVSLDIMLGHVKPSDWRREDIYMAEEIVRDEVLDESTTNPNEISMRLI